MFDMPQVNSLSCLILSFLIIELRIIELSRVHEIMHIKPMVQCLTNSKYLIVH